MSSSHVGAGPGRRHRGRRPDRIQPAVPHRVGLDARPRHAGQRSSCSRSRRPSARWRACGWSSTTAPSRCSTTSCAPTTPTSRSVTPTIALLVGAMPRKQGMERSDLLSANGGIFKPQGEALARSAPPRRQGARRRQPGQHQRPHRDEQRRRPRSRTLHGDDPPRPQPGDQPDRPQARRAGDRREDDDDLGQPLDDAVPRPVPRRGRRQERLRGGRRPRVGRRACSSRPWPSAGAAIIEARGASSAASAANAAVDHIRSWALGTPDDDWVSMAIPSDGSYGVPEGIISSFPSRARAGTTRSCRASRSTTTAGARSTPRSPSSSRSATRSRSSASI